MSTENDKSNKISQGLWNQAIADAEAMLKEANERVPVSRSAVRTFKENSEASEDWPGQCARTLGTLDFFRWMMEPAAFYCKTGMNRDPVLPGLEIASQVSV